MIFSNNIFDIDINLNEPPFTEPKKYWCEFCDIDYQFEVKKEDLYATIVRMPTKKVNLELAFWVKCPKCGNSIFIKRIE